MYRSKVIDIEGKFRKFEGIVSRKSTTVSPVSAIYIINRLDRETDYATEAIVQKLRAHGRSGETV